MSSVAPAGLSYMSVLEVGGRVTQDDIPGLCRRLTALLQQGPVEVVCDVRRVTDPDAATVDAIARLQMIVADAGFGFRVRGASDRLVELVSFMGLDEVLIVEPGWQAEQRKELLGVEEERDPMDLATPDVDHL